MEAGVFGQPAALHYKDILLARTSRRYGVVDGSRCCTGDGGRNSADGPMGKRMGKRGGGDR